MHASSNIMTFHELNHGLGYLFIHTYSLSQIGQSSQKKFKMKNFSCVGSWKFGNYQFPTKLIPVSYGNHRSHVHIFDLYSPIFLLEKEVLPNIGFDFKQSIFETYVFLGNFICHYSWFHSCKFRYMMVFNSWAMIV
jgi:hypothetical protein